jgi:thiol-disulfide isomerase/thioredoxin/sugar lactone lactonase YvrE
LPFPLASEYHWLAYSRQRCYDLGMNTADTTSSGRARKLLIAAFILLGAWLVSRSASPWFAGQEAASVRLSSPQAADGHPFARRFAAPEIDGGVEWVNVEQPITLASLRGRFVLVDFWTYCCINCMHVLPELKKLEHAFPNELVVIGVHSAKFDGEHDSQNIREAVERYEIEHPVVNDAEMRIWDRFGARSWPTLVLIDPAGEGIWAATGERTLDEIKAVIDKGLPYYRAQGLLKPAPRPKLTADASQATPLRFPGKILADEADGGRLFIADSNHNRIVVSGLDGQVRSVIGSGEIGKIDGASDKAEFNHPQGLARVGETLYVADAENHLLRRIDLKNGQVTTIAGTGEKGAAWPAARMGEFLQNMTARGGDKLPRGPKATALSTPWDILAHGGSLYIAMAGTHQIWKMPLTEGEIGPYAGSGREAINDGSLLPKIPYDPSYASFAQPSGLASDGQRLYIADSEGSIIRSVPYEAAGVSQSVVGPTGATLFEFGDKDGKAEQARFQHPLGVAWYKGKLYVADTYNNKIKVVDVAQRTCRTLAGTGKPGRDDGDGAKATFNEPGGLTAAGDKLFVADTNNHLIRVVELAAPNRVSTLAIEGLTPP